MTRTVSPRGRDRLYWALAAGSAAFGCLLLRIGGLDAFRAGVGVAALLAAICMAIGDVRTSLLRNAWTAPFAAAALSQTLIVALALPDKFELVATIGVALLVNAGAYLAMGLIGWVGFGDVKFMVGLTLFGALVAGAPAILLAPIALFVAAATRAISPGVVRASRPHGPALAVAFAFCLTTAWS